MIVVVQAEIDQRMGKVRVADILQDFPIHATADRVFQAMSSPAGLDRWWTNRASGAPVEGADYDLSFGPEHQWLAKVTRCVPGAEFELEFVRADADWTGTRVGFDLETRGTTTWVRFRHVGWPSPNEHYRISCHCWAMYLRILRRYLEHGDSVPYENRLEA